MNTQYGNAYYSGGQPMYPTAPMYPTPPNNYSVFVVGADDNMTDSARGGGSSNSSRDREDTGMGFSSKSIRRAFIRKVCCLLSLQLLVTLAIIAVFVLVDPVKKYVQAHQWVWMLCTVVFTGTYFTLVCCDDYRRKVPTNYVCLAALTIALAGSAGSVGTFYNLEIVLYAAGVTALVTIALTLFATQTKIDFTMCTGMIFVATIVMIVFGFAVIFSRFLFGEMKILEMVYSALSALLFCLYLVYDIQMMTGGRRASLSEEEYVYAATQIYVDIVMIFMDLLSLFGNME